MSPERINSLEASSEVTPDTPTVSESPIEGSETSLPEAEKEVKLLVPPTIPENVISPVPATAVSPYAPFMVLANDTLPADVDPEFT